MPRKLRSVRLPALLLVATAALGLTACGSDEDPAPAKNDDSPEAIVVTDAVIPVPPNPSQGALYFEAHNGTDVDDAIVEVKVDGAGTADLHRSEVTDDGLSTMKHVDRIELPAGEHVELTPGGYHVMVDDPPALEIGETVSVTIGFAEAPSQTVDAKIVDTVDGDDDHDHHEHHD